MQPVISIDRNDLKLLIKEAVREVIAETNWDFFLKRLDFVSADEMADIETLYGEPDKDVHYSEELEI